MLMNPFCLKISLPFVWQCRNENEYVDESYDVFLNYFQLSFVLSFFSCANADNATHMIIQHANKTKKKKFIEMFHYFLTLHMWRVSYHRNHIKKIWGNLIMITKHNELKVTVNDSDEYGIHVNVHAFWWRRTLQLSVQKLNFEASGIKGIGYNSGPLIDSPMNQCDAQVS